MRGKGSFVLLLGELIRITPACAGKRLRLTGICHILEDHPRMCGEKMMKAGSNCAMLGSPPRMRGKASGKSWDQRRAGITPAYAGKRVAAQIFRNLNRDHPRVCGEKKSAINCGSFTLGSPPRMRGKD